MTLRFGVANSQRRIAVLAILLSGALAAAQSAVAQAAVGQDSFGSSERIGADSSVDWEKATLSLILSATVADSGKNAPAAAYRSEQDIDRSLPQMLARAILPLQVDSLHTAADLVTDSPGLYQSFGAVSNQAQKGYPTYSSDLHTVTIPYGIPLFPAIGTLFIQHTEPTQINRTLRWVPTNKFTGLVIYAKGNLPLHGTAKSDFLAPCLFPKILDSNMRTVVKNQQMDPSYLMKWGAVAYTQGFGENDFIDRIGLSPLRVVALGLFGKTPTDPIISADDADKLLSTDNNRRILAQGRILIIYGSP
ncbi:MAG TPA: hypothetical protein VMW87_00525 [Spirochaetia bacterium]|nr:hypothetical protein [Spirochaetia bacterium]